MRYTLQIVGGPKTTPLGQDMGGVSVTFSVENETVATVDKYREVTGLEVGNTVLFYEVV